MYVVNTKTYAKIARFIERSLLSDKGFKITNIGEHVMELLSLLSVELGERMRADYGCNWGL